MSGSHNFLVFDENKANMVDNTTYRDSQYRQNGVSAGIAPSNIHNKMYYQATLMMASLAQALANKGYNITDTDPNGLVEALQGLFLPVGTILFLPRANPSVGFIVADGSLLNRSAYSALWDEAQASGNLVSDAQWFSDMWGAYSTGDGSTTFRAPDLRGEFIRGLDLGRGVDPGRVVGSWQADQNKLHDHVLSGSTYTEDGIVYSHLASGGSRVDTGMSLSVTPSGGSEARSRNIALLPCIKY